MEEEEEEVERVRSEIGGQQKAVVRGRVEWVGRWKIDALSIRRCPRDSSTGFFFTI